MFYLATYLICYTRLMVFEGIVPLELALCLNDFIKGKYFTLDELNKLIKSSHSDGQIKQMHHNQFH